MTPRGASSVCPIDPPAFNTPKARPALFSGTFLLIADIATANPAIPVPPAERSPIAITISKVVLLYGIRKQPKAAKIILKNKAFSSQIYQQSFHQYNLQIPTSPDLLQKQN